MGDARTQDESSLFLCATRYLQGEMRTALALAEAAHKSASLRADVQLQCHALLWQAEVTWALGQGAQFEERMLLLEPFVAPAAGFELEAPMLALYYGLAALRALKRPEQLDRLEQLERCLDSVRRSREAWRLTLPTLFFAFLAPYHSLTALALIKRRDETSKGSLSLPPAVLGALKKQQAEVSKDLALLDEFVLVFSQAEAAQLLLRAQGETVPKKRTRLLEEALASAQVHRLKWFEALAHRALGLVDVRDSTREAAEKLKHADSAAELYAIMGVTEAASLW